MIHVATGQLPHSALDAVAVKYNYTIHYISLYIYIYIHIYIISRYSIIIFSFMLNAYRCVYITFLCVYIWYVNKIRMFVRTDDSCFLASKANVGYDVRNENVPGTLVVLLIFFLTLMDFFRALLRVRFYCSACYLPGSFGLKSWETATIKQCQSYGRGLLGFLSRVMPTPD